MQSSSNPEPGRIARPAKPGEQRGWSRWLPGLRTLREYDVAWLRHDIVAGLVLTTMLVPVGIAYAVASGLPGIYGLYATIVPLLAYALFGPSRILVLGPDSALVAVILAVVVPLSGGDPHRAVAIASMMAIVSGTVCILAGIARLGFITELLSKPIRYGYMNGIALTVIVSQLPKLFGFSGEGEGPLRRIWAFAQAVLAGETNWAALAVGAGTLAVILLLKGSKRIPGILIAIVGATAIVGALDLATRADVSVLGPIPQGLPCVRHPVDHLRRHRPDRDRRLRGRTHFVRRHERAVAHVSPREPERVSTRIRKRWDSASPISRPASFRASPSAAARRARRWPRPRAGRHS